MCDCEQGCKRGTVEQCVLLVLIVCLHNRIKRLTASFLGLVQAATKFFESQTASKVGEETGITWVLQLILS